MALSSWRHSSHGNHSGSYFRQLGSKTRCSAKKTAIYFALQCASVLATHWHAKRMAITRSLRGTTAMQYGADPGASAFSSRAGVSFSPAMECQERLEARAALAGCHPRFCAEGHHRVGEVDRIPALSCSPSLGFLVGRLDGTSPRMMTFEPRKGTRE